MIKKYKNFILLCIFLIIIIFSKNTFAEYMKAPNSNYYKNPVELYEKDTFIESWSEWIIFASKNNIKIYKSPDMKEQIGSANYLERFKVKSKKRNLIQIKGDQKNIDSIFGWSEIQNFIILPQSIKTENSVKYKALIVNKQGAIKGKLYEVKPLRSPEINAEETGEEIKLLDFVHVYKFYPDYPDDPISNKFEPEYVLLGSKHYFVPKFDNKNTLSINNVILGWVKYNRFLIWNTREGLQPFNERKHPIYFFKTIQEIKEYYNTHVDNDEEPETPLVVNFDKKDKLDKSAWPKEKPRYAILNKNDDVTKPFEIGISSTSLDALRVRSVIEDLLEKSKNRDIVFVIDGTWSMEPYIKLVGDIINRVMENFNKAREEKQEVGNLRFGVAIYRDYPSDDNSAENYAFEIIKKLTSDAKSIQLEISKVLVTKEDCKQNINSDTCFPEAVFNGLVRSIKDMNWAGESRKMIIHIGDNGNHNKKDPYNEDDIVKLLVENDISYHAIQIVAKEGPESFKKAQKSFNSQVRRIIKNTVTQWAQKVENSDLIETKNDLLSELNNIINIGKQSCSKSCCDYIYNKKSRWSLRCLETEGSYYSKNITNLEQYTKIVMQQIDEISTEVYESRSILGDLILGKLSKAKFKTNDTSYKPLLMPGVIEQLIKNIGKDMLDNNADNSLESLPVYNSIKDPLKQFLVNTDLSFKERKQKENELINIIGSFCLKQYLKEDVQFYTKAFVMCKRPGNLYAEDPFQLKKMVLFTRDEFESLIRPFRYFVEKYQCNITPKNIKDIWRSLLTGIIGDKAVGYVQLSMKLNEEFLKQHGITLRYNHPLLKISYSEIVAGLERLPDEEKKELETFLCNTQAKLTKILDDDDRFFSILGVKHIWIDASELP